MSEKKPRKENIREAKTHILAQIMTMAGRVRQLEVALTKIEVDTKELFAELMDEEEVEILDVISVHSSGSDITKIEKPEGNEDTSADEVVLEGMTQQFPEAKPDIEKDEWSDFDGIIKLLEDDEIQQAQNPDEEMKDEQKDD